MNNGVCVMYAFNQKVDAGGRKRVDLVDRFGTTFRNAYVMSGAGLPLNVPIQQDNPDPDFKSYPAVVVGAMQGEPTPVVLGALDNANVTYTNESDTTTNYDEHALGGPKLTGDADVDTDTDVISMEEVALAAPQGGRLLLKRNGHAVIAGVGVSIQVLEGSYVRISAAGDTEGRIPLVDPVVEVLDNMSSKINDLQDEVRELRATLSSSFTIVLPSLLVDPTTSIVTCPTSIVSGVVTALKSLIPEVGTSTSTPLQPLDPLTISSATLRVGSATEV